MPRYKKDEESNREDREECITLLLDGVPSKFYFEDEMQQKAMLPRVSMLPDLESLPQGMFANPTPGTWPVTPETESYSGQSGESISSSRLSLWAYAPVPRELEFVTSSFEDV